MSVSFKRWIVVMGLHFLLVSFLTIMNVVNAFTSMAVVKKLDGYSNDDNIKKASQGLKRLSIIMFVFFVLMFMGAFVLVLLTLFKDWAIKYGEYILLLIEIFQSVLFFYAMIEGFKAMNDIKASSLYKNGNTEVQAAAVEARNLAIINLVTFLIITGYIIYIIVDIVKRGGFRKRLLDHSSGVGQLNSLLGFTAPSVVLTGRDNKLKTSDTASEVPQTQAVKQEIAKKVSAKESQLIGGNI